MLTDMQKAAAMTKEAKRLGISYGKLAAGLGDTAWDRLFEGYERALALRVRQEKKKTAQWEKAQRKKPLKDKPPQ